MLLLIDFPSVFKMVLDALTIIPRLQHSRALNTRFGHHLSSLPTTRDHHHHHSMSKSLTHTFLGTTSTLNN